MSFGMILDLLIVACGVYIVFWAVQMKSSNKIPEMLVGKGFPDRPGEGSGGIYKAYVSLYISDRSDTPDSRAFGGTWNLSAVSCCRHGTAGCDSGGDCRIWNTAYECTEKISGWNNEIKGMR